MVLSKNGNADLFGATHSFRPDQVLCMSDPREKPQFGKKSANTIVISSNGKVREYRVHAGIFLALGAIFTMFMVGYVTATTYLAFRDDLMAAAIKRNIEMQRAYEDRIAALRSKVDRITSRQLLDQQAVEAKVAALMKQQEMLTGQTGALKGLFERARKHGLDVDAAGEIGKKARLETDTIITGSIESAENTIFADAGSLLRGSAIGQKSGEQIAIATHDGDINGQTLTPQSGLFVGVLDQINSISTKQRAAVLALQADAHSKASKLASVYEKLNVPVPGNVPQDIGGPFIPDNAVEFDDLAEGLNDSLETLETLKKQVKRLPVGNPVPGAAISSTFGTRVDPFHRRNAFHSGLDFRARTGTPVVASGAGKVVKAGSHGGYGLMVEIDHGHGLRTRYAHLSRIEVNIGTSVASGQRIGRVGSTGRSTGPHLHYEVRRSQKASNPAGFLKIGKQISNLL